MFFIFLGDGYCEFFTKEEAWEGFGWWVLLIEFGSVSGILPVYIGSRLFVFLALKISTS